MVQMDGRTETDLINKSGILLRSIENWKRASIVDIVNGQNKYKNLVPINTNRSVFPKVIIKTL